MTDTPAPSTLSLPKGLPPGPWSANLNLVLDGKGNPIAHYCISDDLARAIASIPDMVKEIERLTAFNADLIAQNESLHKSCTIEHRDYDGLRAELEKVAAANLQHHTDNSSLRARNAELEEHLEKVCGAFEWAGHGGDDPERCPACEAYDKARTILTKAKGTGSEHLREQTSERH